jgi:hypothetical protein
MVAATASERVRERRRRTKRETKWERRSVYYLQWHQPKPMLIRNKTRGIVMF